MNNVIEQMLMRYEIKNTNDEINALKEIIQEIILSGLVLEVIPLFHDFSKWSIEIPLLLTSLITNL